MTVFLEILEGAAVGIGGVALVAVYFWALGRQHENKMREVEREQERSKVRFSDAKTRAMEKAANRGANVRIIGEVLDIQQWGYAPVPNTYSPHIQYHNDNTVVSEEKQEQKLLPAPVQAPTIESIVAQLPYNELMTAFGVTLEGGKLIDASIPASVHFKLVGGSGFGKSCEAAALLRIATQCNDADHLQIALLDLEHKTSRLFENLPHVATLRSGRKSIDMAMSGPSADEVAYKLAALVQELQRRAAKGIETPVLLIYVEEMLSLQYEVDEALLASMLAHLAILAVRGRKYGMFLEACTQIDYSTPELRVATKQFRSRIAFAVDPTAAKASGFINNQLIKQNFQAGQPGQFVLEMPGFSQLMVAPLLDVKQELKRLEVPTSQRTRPTSNYAEVGRQPTSNVPDFRVVDSVGSLDGKRAEVGFDEDGPSRSNETLSEKAVEVIDMLKQRKGQNEIIQNVWKVSGGGRAYQSAMEEYREIVAQILERRA